MTGTPVPIQSLRRRMQTLEDELRSLRAEAVQLRRSGPSRNNAAETYVAKTAADTSYPSAPANVFGIIFQTVSFTRSEGNQTPTYTAHSASVQDFALSLVGYIEVGTVVLVKRQRNGQYVIVRADNTATGSCIDSLDGHVLDDLTTSTNPSYVLGLDGSGCLVKVEVDVCT